MTFIKEVTCSLPTYPPPFIILLILGLSASQHFNLITMAHKVDSKYEFSQKSSQVSYLKKRKNIVVFQLNSSLKP